MFSQSLTEQTPQSGALILSVERQSCVLGAVAGPSHSTQIMLGSSEQCENPIRPKNSTLFLTDIPMYVSMESGLSLIHLKLIVTIAGDGSGYSMSLTSGQINTSGTPSTNPGSRE